MVVFLPSREKILETYINNEEIFVTIKGKETRFREKAGNFLFGYYFIFNIIFFFLKDKKDENRYK